MKQYKQECHKMARVIQGDKLLLRVDLNFVGNPGVFWSFMFMFYFSQPFFAQDYLAVALYDYHGYILSYD